MSRNVELYFTRTVQETASVVVSIPDGWTDDRAIEIARGSINLRSLLHYEDDGHVISGPEVSFSQAGMDVATARWGDDAELEARVQEEREDAQALFVRERAALAALDLRRLTEASGWARLMREQRTLGDERAAALVAERAELEETLANERGEGEGPSEGWEWDSDSSDDVMCWRWVDPLGFDDEGDTWTVTQGDNGWIVWINGLHTRGMDEPELATAREAMRVADKARSLA